MPYKINAAKGGGYNLVRKDTGKVKSHHSTKGKAQMAAYYSEHEGHAPPGSRNAKKDK